MKIYLASSWRNPHQPSVLERLRAASFVGHLSDVEEALRA